jgi:hypothetical protein
LLFDNKEIVVNLESPPKFSFEKTKNKASWMPLKIDKSDLWDGEKNVCLEYNDELWCLKNCFCKDYYLNFSSIKHAI